MEPIGSISKRQQAAQSRLPVASGSRVRNDGPSDLFRGLNSNFRILADQLLTAFHDLALKILVGNFGQVAPAETGDTVPLSPFVDKSDVITGRQCRNESDAL